MNSHVIEMYSLIINTNPFRSGRSLLFVSLLIAPLFLPSLLLADPSTHTYDKQSIRYPSMDTGQVWAKSRGTPSLAPRMDAKQIFITDGGKASFPLGKSMRGALTKDGDTLSPTLTKDAGKVRATVGENSSPATKEGSPPLKNETDQYTEAKKRMKRRHFTARTPLKNGNTQQASLNTSLPLKSHNWEEQKTSAEKSAPPIKTTSSVKNGIEMKKKRHPGNNWYYKQELYDVECGLKLARVIVTYYFDKKNTLLSSTTSPDAQWYHIYPGSFEERLYIDICHPR